MLPLARKLIAILVVALLALGRRSGPPLAGRRNQVAPVTADASVSRRCVLLPFESFPRRCMIDFESIMTSRRGAVHSINAQNHSSFGQQSVISVTALGLSS